MKKILSVFAMFAVCVIMSSCSTEADKQCGKIAEAMLANNWEQVSTLSDQLYEKKGECQARNLIDLALAYNGVANQQTQNAPKYEAIKKVIDCYDTAMSKDADAAKKCIEVSKVDLASMVAQYKEMAPQYEAAIAAEQAAVNEQAAAEEETSGEEAATEEAAAEE